MLSRIRFETTLKIMRVTRIPQSQGKIMVRWYVTDSTRAEARGRTDHVAISDHQAAIDYETKFNYSLGVGMNSGRLRSGNIVFEVSWEPEGAHKMPLGSITLDMAQFVHRSLEPLAFLLENSRVNCLLFLELSLEQTKGASNYTLPPFTAPVLKTDIGASIGLGEIPVPTQVKPSIKSAATRLLEEPVFLHHLREDAASPYSLNPMETIDDIFTGGDGFGKLQRPPNANSGSNLPFTETQVRDDLVSWAVRF